MEEVDKISDVIKKLEVAMRHTHPVSVDILRKNKEQLERLLDFIMELEVGSFLNLEKLLIGNKQCLNDCIRQTYTNKKNYTIRSRDYS